jgi:DNA integrity scanning protein DisA with diadenylate cyclase activity
MTVKKILSKIKDAFKKSEVTLSLEIKLKTAELILNLMTHKKKSFGLFVILGWQNKWKGYTDISDMTQDVFVGHHTNIADIKHDHEVTKEVAKTVDFDGAILINSKGAIMHSGIILEGLRPRFVANKLNPGSFNDLSEQLGFKEKVHSRHLFAIASSYVFKNTTVFTVSEESDKMHIFEGGKIIYTNE